MHCASAKVRYALFVNCVLCIVFVPKCVMLCLCIEAMSVRALGILVGVVWL